MLFYFCDDSKVNTPTRAGMGPLVGVGGFCIDGESVGLAERALESTCTEYGFPNVVGSNEFKWSPGRTLWMREGLINDQRSQFYEAVLAIGLRFGIKARVVINDRNCARANTQAQSHEHDVTTMLIERIQRSFVQCGGNGVIIIDRPGGGRPDEDDFLNGCIETVQNGTRYITPCNVCMNVLSSPSKYIRLLQLADLITGCTMAYVAGEQRYSPRIFQSIKPLLETEEGVIGGYGVKLHPDFRYTNLYHWLLSDTHARLFNPVSRAKERTELPIQARKYATDPSTPG